MSLSENIAEIMRRYDGLVDEKTIQKYQNLFLNYNVPDASALDDALMCCQVNGKASGGDSSKSWLSRNEIFKFVQDDLEKTLAKRRKTPYKGVATQPMKSDGKLMSEIQQTFNASQPLPSQDYSFAKTKESAENFGKEDLCKNRSQMTKLEVKESDKNLKKIQDFINEPFNVRRQAIIRRIKKMTELYTQYLEKMNPEGFTKFCCIDDFISKDLNIFCVGRIVPGPTNDNIMENNVYFECYDSQRDVAQVCALEVKTANQVLLNKGEITTTPECIFFANEVIAIEGSYCRETNTFDVKNLYQETYVPEDQLAEKVGSADFFDDGKYFSMMVVGGPFSFSNAFDLTALEEFLKRVIEVKPNMVIFAGPFLDQSNEAVRTGELVYDGMYRDYTQAFDIMIDMINERLKNLPNTHIVIVPSLSDVHHCFPYPQPPFESKRDKEARFKFTSNPSQFCLNKDIKLGITSTDFLFDVIKSAYVKFSASNKFVLCLKEILNQRMFYPMYPGLIPMDTKNYSNIEFDGVPDIILHRSTLPCGIKAVKNTIFINYGSLMKAKDTGTYATIIVANQLDKPIEERIHVKICKI